MQETLEQIGARNLQALLINPKDGLALHTMIKSFTASVSKQPSKSLTICPALDSSGRTLCSAAMKAQALISATTDQEKLEYGIDSLARIQALWAGGYAGVEDVGYWKHFILKPETQLTLVLKSYTRLIRDKPESVKAYSSKLMVDLRGIWRTQHLSFLTDIEDILRTEGAPMQGKADLLLADVSALKRDLE